jgi:hypothetical protein
VLCCCIHRSLAMGCVYCEDGVMFI